MGVGPEQNFTYIAALQPSIAFIVDIRRGNLQLHLMYKALFELSTDRAGFVSRLFSRPRPDTLGPAATPVDIFDAFAGIPSSEALYESDRTQCCESKKYFQSRFVHRIFTIHPQDFHIHDLVI